MPQRILSALLLVVTVSLLSGCAVWGVYEDKRLTDTMTEDKALASSIKTALMKEKFLEGWSVNVYSYYRHVFLVGEVPGDMQTRAVEIAQNKNPRSVTPHWFTKSKNDSSDLALAAKLRTALIGTRGLSSTRIDTEVNAGRVVLLGVVDSEHEKDLANTTAKGVEGVTRVTSYLMLPMGKGSMAPEESAGETAAQPSTGKVPGSKTSDGIESRDL